MHQAKSVFTNRGLAVGNKAVAFELPGLLCANPLHHNVKVLRDRRYECNLCGVGYSKAQSELADTTAPPPPPPPPKRAQPGG